MKILTISHQYPSTFSAGPMMIFHRHVAGLTREKCVEKVICPVPAVLFPLGYFSRKWKKMAEIPVTMAWDGAEVFYPRYLAFPRRLFYASAGKRMFSGISRTVDRIYGKFGFDLVHCHTCYPDGFVGSLVKNKYRVPLVITVHGSDLREINDVSLSVRARIMQALQFADSVISPHPELTGILKDLKISKVSEIPNGIDIDSFSQKSGVARIIKEFNLKGMRVVSFIANLTDFKDPETFVRSAPYVLERNPDTIFLVVGDGYLKNKLVQIAKELNINSHFIFTGVRDDISSILAATDVFAALGTVENIWSTNILEAMASNVPCIVTLAGNTARYLTHRKNAYLVRTKDPAAVGAAITELINDRQLRENISSEAFEIIKERFDNCIVAKKTKDLYSKLIVSGI